MFKKLYPELLKRMDDAKDVIRIQTCQTWSEYFKSIKAWQKSLEPLIASLPESERDKSTIVLGDGEVVEIKIDDLHYDAIVNGLLIHMDDTNSILQVNLV
jgi:dynein assembly factor 5